MFIVLLLLLLPLFSCSKFNAPDYVQVENGVLNLTAHGFSQLGYLPLAGSWKFKPLADSIDFASPSFDDSSWEQLTVPGDWNHKISNGQGYGWLRLTVKLPRLEAPLKLGISIRRFNTAYEFYINGKLLMSSGKVGFDKESEISNLKSQLHVVELPIGTEELVLAIRGSNFHHARGGLEIAPWLGKSQPLKVKIWWEDFGVILGLGILLIAAVINLMFWLIRLEEKSYLYLAIFSMAIMIYQMAANDLLENFFCYSQIYEWRRKAEYLGLILAAITFYHYHCQFFQVKAFFRLHPAVNLFALFFLIFTMVATDLLYSRFLWAYLIYIVAIVFMVVFISLRETIRKNTKSYLMTVAFGLVFLGTIHDILVFYQVFQPPKLLLASMVIFIVLTSLNLALVHGRAFSEMKRLMATMQKSEQFYLDVINSASDMIFISDIGMRTTYCNSAAREYYQLGHRQFVFIPLPFFWCGDSLDMVQDSFEEVMESHKPISVVAGCLDVLHDVRLTPVIQDGEVVQVVCIVRDLTERIKMENELRERENRLAIILDNVQAGVVLIDIKTHRVIEINSIGAEVIGLPKGKIKGGACSQFICHDEEQDCPVLLGKVKKLNRVERQLRTASGKTVPIIKSALPITLGGKNVILESFIDITELKVAEDALAKAYDKLTEMNVTLKHRVRDELSKSRAKDHIIQKQTRQASMGEMIGNIAHQWRQPLSGLSSIIQDLQDAFQYDELDEDYMNRSVEQAKQLAGHMSKTIDDFRNFFKPDKEKILFDLKDSIKHSLSIIDASLKNNYIEVKMEGENGFLVNGYPREFEQVVLNIISNAQGALKETGRENHPFVEIKIIKQDEDVVVSIADNGGGIPEDIIDKVFEPYFTTKDQGQGTGVGLYMSKTIVEKNMGGILSVDNIDGGAQFNITLPQLSGNGKTEVEKEREKVRDPHTGLLNRKGFITLGQQQLDLIRAGAKEMVLVLIKLSNFPSLNESSIQQSDQAIRDLADLITDTFRSSDLPFRIAQDHFVVLAAVASSDDAHLLKEHLDDSITNHNSSKKREYLLAVTVETIICDLETDISLAEIIDSSAIRFSFNET